MLPHAMLNVEITKGGTDNTMSVIRKFSRRVQSSGLIPYVRKHRYWDRSLSDAKKKQSALHRIEKSAERTRLIKEGKISEAPERGHRRGGFRMPSTSPKATTEKASLSTEENTDTEENKSSE